jgi:hypothetical protein
MSFDLLVVFGTNGCAFMFPHAMNITTWMKEEIQLMRELHMVADIHLITRETTR